MARPPEQEVLSVAGREIPITNPHKVLFPQAAGISIYLLMAAILLWKPEGLFRQG